MTKIFCDLCGKEFKQNELLGGMMRLERVYSIQNNMPVAGGQVNKRMIDVCEDCADKLWKYADTLKTNGKV